MNLDILKRFYPRFLEDEKTNLERIQIPEQKKHYISFYSSNNVHLAVYAMYIEKDFAKARNYFYKAAVSAEYMINNHSWELQTSIPKICYALFSDNIEVIERYKSIKDKNPNPDFVGYQFVTGIQSVLQNDLPELENQIKALKKSTKKKGEDCNRGFVTVFEGLKNQNKNVIELGLKELIQTHKRREKIAIVGDYFSVEAAALAKLAYRKGIEVEIKSSLIPNEILPINELKQYDGFELFKELET